MKTCDFVDRMMKQEPAVVSGLKFISALKWFFSRSFFSIFDGVIFFPHFRRPCKRG
jgi:hypothetical protein